LDFLEVPHPPVVLPPSRLRRQADGLTEEWLASYRRVRDGLRPLPDRWQWTGQGFEPA